MRNLFILLFLFLIVGKISAQSPLCPSTSTSFCCEYVASITINGQTYAGNTGFSGPGYYDYTSTPVPTLRLQQPLRFQQPYLMVVYMRFIMVFSSSPTICSNYSYVNTFDFKTTITGAIDNFDHQLTVLNTDSVGVSNVPVQLWVSQKNQNNFSLNTTYNTDSNGLVDINTTLRTDLYDFRLISH